MSSFRLQSGYYTPVVLSNGLDYCQLDFSGSMAFKDHCRGYFSFWYKAGRPQSPDPFGLVKLGYQFISSAGPVEIGEFNQEFDPDAETLTTDVAFLGCRILVTTRLLPESTLVEEFEVLEISDSSGMLDFTVTSPARTYTNHPVDSLGSRATELTWGVTNAMGTVGYRCDHPLNPFHGSGWFSLVHDDESAGEIRVTENGLQQLVRVVRKGQKIVRVSTLFDNLQCADFEQQGMRTHRHVLAGLSDGSGPLPVVPPPAAGLTDSDNAKLVEMVRVSRYVCAASIGPKGSSVSCLAIPNGHSMGTYWDIWYSHAALLRWGRVQKAAEIIAFWHMAYPEAKRVARDQYQVGGARFEWVLGWDGRPVYYAEQLHNNIIPLLTIWEQYDYTRDRTLLEDGFDLMVDCHRFLAESAIVRDADASWHLRELISVDESLKPKRDELLTVTVMKRGCHLLRQVCALLDRPVPADLYETEMKVDAILKGLRKEGIPMPYAGAAVGSWAQVLAYLHLPDKAAFEKILPVAIEGCRESEGLGIGRASRMRCAVFPWVSGIFAWAMARNGHPQAGEYIQACCQITNFAGGIPEYVWAHGEPSREWLVAAHGVLLAALADTLAQRRGEDVYVLPCGGAALPFECGQLYGIGLPGAVEMSMTIRERRITHLTLRNNGTAGTALLIHGLDATPWECGMIAGASATWALT